MYQFFESIKVEDQQVFLLDLHQKRIDETFASFGEDVPSLNLSEITKTLKIDENGLYKLRISYDIQRNYNAKLIPYAIPETDDFQLVVNDNLEYHFKSEDRKRFLVLKEKSPAEEVIIVQNGSITDTTFSNILFLKDKEWFTPKSFLLNGVMRQDLLRNKKIKEAEITLNTIKDYSHFQLINAMNDFDDMFIYPISKIINLPKDSNEDYL